MIKRLFQPLLAVMLLVPSGARAEEPGYVINEPLWELGLFAGIAALPHYRGSDQYDVYALPVPYFVYRGEVIQTGRDGLNGIFYDSDYLETSFSFNGNPPVDDENNAREGMDDLPPLLEGGPALKWYPLGYDPVTRFYFRPAIRAVMSIDDGFDTGYEGWRGGINMIYRKRNFLGDEDVTAGINIGVEFSSKEYNRYFYEVTEKDATDARPAFRPDAGYGGMSFSANIMREFTDTISAGLYGRYENLRGTAFEDSPLVKELDSFVGGFALVYRFKASKTIVHIDP